MENSLCIKAGIPGISSLAPATLDFRSCPPSNLRSIPPDYPSSVTKNNSWSFSFSYPLPSLWPREPKSRHDATTDDAVLLEEEEEVREEDHCGEAPDADANWVFKILRVRSMWRQQEAEDHLDPIQTDERGGCDGQVCEVCSVDDDEDRIVFDRDSFSKLLRRVSLSEARFYSRLSCLGNLAYAIPQIKPENLLTSHGLRFVTSSLEKKEQAAKDDLGKPSSEDVGKDEKSLPENRAHIEGQSPQDKETNETLLVEEEKLQGNRISAAAAYQIAASAASYLHSHTKSMVPLIFSKFNSNEVSSDGEYEQNDSAGITNEEMASLMATTDSVTAVVAAKEEVKQAVADDLNSMHSSPCEWFACDDEQSATRYFVIQGSETLASWQANLLFEPVPFEGFDVLVHRGIYEAAKGMYQQMLPEVRAHLKSCSTRATFRFTGHSLGGSLSLLINLMLLIRGEVPSSSLLPVITFGAPTIMCGGNLLLQKLGLPRGHVKAITMHRDIVPRAFSCHYPGHVAEFLKVVNGNFRKLPCLSNQNLLYAPMGEFLILQPDDKISPNHDLLPLGCGLYLLSYPTNDSQESEKTIQAAQAVFLNSPHPLEILSDRGAYGSGGFIQRDHDMNSYLKSFRNVIRHELNQLRKARRQVRRRFWWPLVASGGDRASIIVGASVASGKSSKEQFNLSGMVKSGKESLKRFGRLVKPQHIHLLVVLLLPARLLILGTNKIL